MNNGVSQGGEPPPKGEKDLIDALRELRKLERTRHGSDASAESNRQLDRDIEQARRRAWGLADALGRETGEAAQGGAPGRHRSPAQEEQAS